MPETVLREAQIQQIHRTLLEEYGVSLLSQVERAGEGFARAARALLDNRIESKYIVVLAGPGDNGAVGLAAARFLHEWGAEVRLVLAVRPAALHAMAAHQYAMLRDLGLEAWGLSLSTEAMAEQEPIYWTGADLILDALLGTGLVGDPRGETADLIRLANSSRRPILSYDVPSGLQGDEGLIYSPCIDATATVTLEMPRRTHIEGWPVVGELWIASFDVPAELYAPLGVQPRDFAGNEVLSLGPARGARY